jgi:hypothetical protein
LEHGVGVRSVQGGTEQFWEGEDQFITMTKTRCTPGTGSVNRCQSEDFLLKRTVPKGTRT